ncbi:glycosyltransferase family 4 protein [Bradyrhizobium jicamae]|uniref:glycosyltransferase family 4 protein n=1 Tax=Bradyrhizobium jicamae TaxID=280332 RepID=UPI001BA7D170|nr:glycosyltransferase family 4 protein [Bradyrhizobium jicamae]MBR0753294.1 glycosyltransferase family 4 protein [Bradyrhizobium jicamae]
MSRTLNPLRLLVATPYGAHGRGGIDRLTDLIIDTIDQRGDLDVKAERLVTRGQKSIYWGAVVFARALFQFCLAARRGKVDLIHIHLAWRGSAYRKLIIAAMARHFRVPYVVHLHAGQFDQFWAEAGPKLRRSINRLFVDSAAIIVLGDYGARVILDRLPGLRDKITILPNASTSPSHPNPDRSESGQTRITFLGFLEPDKGVPQLVDALGRLACRADWRATIAGSGDIEQTRDHARRLNIADRIDFPGWLAPSETAALLQQTDILTLPSFVESLPMAVIEAFAYGIAVVATPVGAVPEVVTHERNGLLVPVGDAAALADALNRLIENGALRRRLGDAGRRDHAERYEINSYTRRLASVWRKAARCRGPETRA